ncbi:hypothetical protein AKJ37_01700 [candidate division MSBL1 archaeon SCGC-AAA259I09]|uniref:Uncharacterized protein n=1 Tax=candidate division MSBL1 archaeon SCGC-AAA259I09 TaxID=1698267 RepID=A0A133UUW8_9EURY|nr:hypothetical protein AKJ37_01700 [candidate division MSBL1 archaeon SCGC-AAA259I09]
MSAHIKPPSLIPNVIQMKPEGDPKADSSTGGQTEKVSPSNQTHEKPENRPECPGVAIEKLPSRVRRRCMAVTQKGRRCRNGPAYSIRGENFETLVCGIHRRVWERKGEPKCEKDIKKIGFETKKRKNPVPL